MSPVRHTQRSTIICVQLRLSLITGTQHSPPPITNKHADGSRAATLDVDEVQPTVIGLVLAHKLGTLLNFWQLTTGIPACVNPPETIILLTTRAIHAQICQLKGVFIEPGSGVCATPGTQQDFFCTSIQ